MSDLLGHVPEALRLAAGMFWQVAWSLVLGFLISAVLQAVVSKDAMRRALGRAGLKEVALATLAGAASSSCSYASAAISRSLFKGGAALIPSLAFLIASTNLVIELGIVLYLLMGWQFMAAEWLGGVVLVAIMALLVRLTYPAGLVERARQHAESSQGHVHTEPEADNRSLGGKLADPATRSAIAQYFAMDWAMLWFDLALGFLIAGALAAFVPDNAWQALFSGGQGWSHALLDAAIGPLVAVLSFVCSIGNVPLAAVLWGAGVSFGGVLSFLFADLIVLPLLDVYRRQYGLAMAAYIACVFYATMVLSGLVMEALFGALDLVPERRHDAMAEMATFRIDHTFWLNLAAAIVALLLFRSARKAPPAASHCAHHGGHGHAHPASTAPHRHD